MTRSLGFYMYLLYKYHFLLFFFAEKSKIVMISQQVAEPV